MDHSIETWDEVFTSDDCIYSALFLHGWSLWYTSAFRLGAAISGSLLTLHHYLQHLPSRP